MSTADGSVGTAVKIVDQGPDDLRWNVVLLGDGYQTSELPAFAADAQTFANALLSTPPFGQLRLAINVYRIDVTSTDSGADDPVGCGGTGAVVRTYFDATFCGGTGSTRQEILTVDATSAKSVALAQVPAAHLVVVLVNSTIYGGSGGAVAVCSKVGTDIALHEMGHTAFGLADEYASPGNGTGGDTYTGSEPIEPNVTMNTGAATSKWAGLLTLGIAMPTTQNADCTQVDAQPSPVPAGSVGTFAGAKYFHCGLYRPQFDCRMREFGVQFCAVCQAEIFSTLQPFLPGPPRLDQLAPAAGDTAGGTIVVLSGAGLFGATNVLFGATPAITWNVDSDRQITALSPPGSGSVGVTVRTPAGVSQAPPAQFAYTAAAAPPRITAVAPATGSTLGGDTVLVTGAGFTGAGTVRFGAVAAAAWNVDSDTQITAVSPAAGAGTADITVTTAVGTSAAGPADQFTFAVPAPAVAGVAPASGAAAGGTQVVVTGSAFTGATAVAFGAAGATFTVDSDTQITAVSPAGAGTVDITVTTPAGASAAAAADQFAYVAAAGAPPAVTGVNPAQGAASGGDTVVLAGSGFTGATGVVFGAAAALGFKVDSAVQISAVSPPGGGTVDLFVTTPAGTSPAVPADQFSYAAPPVPAVTGVNPAQGAGAGGDTVVLAGSGFTGATAVQFGGNAATAFTVDSDQQITATSPAGLQTVDVTVTTAGGTSPASPADQFAYVSAGLPAVTRVSPSIGVAAGGDTVVVTGIGFTGATAVSFGAAPVEFFSVDADFQITVTTPAGSGTVDVVVITPTGTSAASVADRFSYF